MEWICNLLSLGTSLVHGHQHHRHGQHQIVMDENIWPILGPELTIIWLSSWHGTSSSSGHHGHHYIRKNESKNPLIEPWNETDKLMNSTGRDLRRALFSLKQMFQDDKSLVHEFVQNDGLECLIKVGSEADQNYQNYILRGEKEHFLFHSSLLHLHSSSSSSPLFPFLFHITTKIFRNNLWSWLLSPFNKFLYCKENGKGDGRWWKWLPMSGSFPLLTFSPSISFHLKRRRVILLCYSRFNPLFLSFLPSIIHIFRIFHHSSSYFAPFSHLLNSFFLQQ